MNARVHGSSAQLGRLAVRARRRLIAGDARGAGTAVNDEVADAGSTEGFNNDVGS